MQQILEGDFEHNRKQTYWAFRFICLKMFGNPLRCENHDAVDNYFVGKIKISENLGFII